MFIKCITVLLVFSSVLNSGHCETLPKLLETDLIEIGETFAVINITGPIKYKGVKLGGIRIFDESIRNQTIEPVTNTNGTNSKSRRKALRKQSLSRSEGDDRFHQLFNLTGLKPYRDYLLNVTCRYGHNDLFNDEQYFLKVKTLRAHFYQLVNEPIQLQLNHPDAVHYFIKAYRVNSDERSENSLEVTMSSCFGSSLQLPNDLAAGEKYIIEIKYRDANGDESPVKVIEVA